jgi:predicted DNA-binding transcriptional regulator AlpA
MSSVEHQLSDAIQEPLLLPIDKAALLLGMSGRALRRADQCGKVPSPVRIGRNVRWRAAELVAWCNAGCPDRQTWEAVRDSKFG